MLTAMRSQWWRFPRKPAEEKQRRKQVKPPNRISWDSFPPVSILPRLQWQTANSSSEMAKERDSNHPRCAWTIAVARRIRPTPRFRQTKKKTGKADSTAARLFQE